MATVVSHKNVHRIECYKKKNYVDGEADYLLGNTKHLYLFVRNKLNVKLNRGDEDPGIDIDIIFKSIQDESIFPVIVKCFEKHIK